MKLVLLVSAEDKEKTIMNYPVRVSMGKVAKMGLLLAGLSFCGSAAAPKLVLEAEGHDFGRIRCMRTVSCVIPVRNNGDAPLSVVKIESTCGCTTANLGKNEIAPGEGTELLVMYDTGKNPGKSVKQVTLYTNDSSRPVVPITILSEVLPADDVVPSEVELPFVDGASKAEGVFTFLHPEKEILGVQSSHPAISGVLEEAGPDKVLVHVTYEPGKADGRDPDFFQANLNLKLAGQERTSVHVPLRIMHSAPYKSDPAELVLRKGEKTYVHIMSVAGTPFSIRQIDVPGGAFAVKVVKEFPMAKTLEIQTGTEVDPTEREGTIRVDCGGAFLKIPYAFSDVPPAWPTEE